MVASISTLSSAPFIDPAPVRATAARVAAQHDALLVRRFNEGDESAFVEIADRYRSKLISHAFGHIHNLSDAEEIAQEALIRAHRGLVRFRGDSSLCTWLYRITLNLARNRYWYYFRRRRHLSVSFDTPISFHSSATFADFMATDEDDPVREIVAREFTEQVLRCLDELAAPAREILALRIMQDLSYSEIARKLKIKIGTVKSRIGRARANLRLLLCEACPELDSHVGPSGWFNPLRPTVTGLERRSTA